VWSLVWLLITTPPGWRWAGWRWAGRPGVGR
jgi:hypothetical protein